MGRQNMEWDNTTNEEGRKIWRRREAEAKPNISTWVQQRLDERCCWIGTGTTGDVE